MFVGFARGLFVRRLLYRVRRPSSALPAACRAGVFGGRIPLVPGRRTRRRAGRPLRPAPRGASRGGLPGARRSPSRAVPAPSRTLYVTYSVGIGLGVGLVYVPSVGAVQPWFGANRALASGFAVAGIGAGNIAGPLLAAWWIGLFGWRGAYFALALFVLGPRRRRGAVAHEPSQAQEQESQVPVCAWRCARRVLASLCLAHPELHWGLRADGPPRAVRPGRRLERRAGRGAREPHRPGQPPRALHRRRLCRSHRAPAFAPLDLSGPGRRCSWCGSPASSYWLLALFAVVFGMCYGAAVALLPTIVMDLYGARAVSGIIGFLYTGAGIGTLLGPWLAGVAYDALGTYRVPIVAAAAILAPRRRRRGSPDRE